MNNYNYIIKLIYLFINLTGGLERLSAELVEKTGRHIITVITRSNMRTKL
jgi:hypothetical protein